MHDLFERVVGTELQLFPVDLLNSGISWHDFPHNRPSPIESTSRIH